MAQWRRTEAVRLGGRAFTLIEVLVTIAMIALLIGILLPSLGKVEATKRALKEESNAHQLLVGWSTYCSDYKDRVIPGYQHWDWAHPQPQTSPAYPHRMGAPNPNNPNVIMEGTPVKPWPWRFIGATSLDPAILVFEQKRLAKMRGMGTTAGWDIYGFSTGPSMGYNAVFIGGHYLHGAFHHNDDTPNPKPPGTFYMTRLDQTKSPSELIVFGSARGAGTSSALGEGYYYIRPPGACPTGMHATSASGGWNPSNTWNPSMGAETWGYLSMRHTGRAAVATVDGHVELQGLERLRDMRKWSNFADRKDWTFVPAP